MADTKKLSDIASYIARGIPPIYDNIGTLILNQKCVRDNRVSKEEAKFTNSQKKSINPQKLLQKWDVLVNSTGEGTLGRVGQYQKQWGDCTVDSHVTIVRPNLSLVDGLYFGYVMIFRQPAIAIMGEGATGQTELSRVRLGSEINISLPPLPVQRKIAGILSAYDDLIENNRRRIVLLEEMAQALYREWFMHFRYPGHEQDALVESALGAIPEGWGVKAFGELLKYHIGGGWGKDVPDEEYTERAYVIRGTDIPSARYVSVANCPLRFHKKSNIASRQIQVKDIIFEVSGGSKGQPVGRALQVSQQLINAFDEDLICASFCKILRVKEEIIRPEVLFFHLQEIYRDGRIEKYQVQSTGIINFKFVYFLENEMIIIPSTLIQEQFVEIINPMLETVQVLGAKNANLRRTRDLLLPRLIGGELDVAGLDMAGLDVALGGGDVEG